MKKIINYLLLLAILPFIFVACTDNDNGGSESPVLAKGGRYYKGVLRINENEYIRSLFPPSIVDVYSYRVATQIYEGLFKFDSKTLNVVQSIAQSYEVDTTRTVYTIKLRAGVFFHDDPSFPNGKGRELIADDVKNCIQYACSQDRSNQAYHILEYARIKGVKAYYEASKDKSNSDLEGVKVIDKYTIQFILDEPNSLFLYTLARPELFIYPKEAYEKYGLDMRTHAVGTGPFKLGSIDENISIILKRNENYYRKDEHGNQLPFLDAISIQFIKDKKTELFEFRKQNLDMVYRVPTDFIVQISEEVQKTKKYELLRKPEMQTQMLVFMNQDGVFKDVNVRKAFSYAVDREKILDYVLNGDGYAPGQHGITPPTFQNKGYDIDQVKGYSFSEDSARYYLAQAGYEDGKGFPTLFLDLNPEGDRHTVVALEVQKQLKDVLNIDISLRSAPHAVITDKSMSGQYELIRLSWVADFPSPEAFLRMLYGKDVPVGKETISFPNIPRYTNLAFDSLYDLAINAATEEESYKYFIQAENVAMQDAPVIVLWYDEGYRLLQTYVKNLPNNPMQYRDFSATYIAPQTQKESGKELEESIETSVD
jgi:peptide/nickel transport system substrate-binding protein